MRLRFAPVRKLCQLSMSQPIIDSGFVDHKRLHWTLPLVQTKASDDLGLYKGGAFLVMHVM